MYHVTTSDGYILKLYRIPSGKNKSSESTQKVVLLQHGLHDSCDSWVANYENHSLAFILANKNYDVWLGNNRGNKYSRNHTTYNPDKDKEFWNFSAHEMGTIDLPTIIDFILNKTEKSKISYIGHSQGTAQLFAALTLMSEYFSERLDKFLAFGPVSNLQNIKSPFYKTFSNSNIDKLITNLNILNEFPKNNKSFDKLKNFFCKQIPNLCINALHLVSDSVSIKDDISRFLVFNSHFPSGGSFKSMHHFAECIRSGKLVQLDRDRTPYDISKIKNVPIYLFVGEADLLATVEDNLIFKKLLEKIGVLRFYKEYKGYGHITFFISTNNEHVDDVLEILKEK